MGVDYYQKAIVGVKLSVKDLKKVVSPAIYEDQPRYDTKTGKVKGHERVLVKQEQSVYAIGPYEFKDQYSIQFNKHELYVDLRDEGNTSDEVIYIGLTAPIDMDKDMGVDGEFLDGSISLSGLSDAIDEVREKFRELELYDLMKDVELHFYTYVSY